MFRWHKQIVSLLAAFSMFDSGISDSNHTIAETYDAIPVYKFNKQWQYRPFFSFDSSPPLVPRFEFLNSNACLAAPFKQILLHGPTTCSNGHQATFLTFERRKCKGFLQALSFNGDQRRIQRDSDLFRSFKITCGEHLELSTTTMQYLLTLYDPPKLELIRGVLGLAVRIRHRGVKKQLPKVIIFVLAWALYHAAVGYADLRLNEYLEYDSDIFAAFLDCLLTSIDGAVTVLAIFGRPNGRFVWLEAINDELEFGRVGFREHHHHHRNERSEDED